jgi:hypothetical protein
MPTPIPGPGQTPPPVPPANSESFKDFRWLNALRNRVLATVTSISVNTGNDVGGNSSTSATGDAALTLNLSPTGVTAGTYGDSTHVAQFTVDTKGRLSSASNVLVSTPPFPVVTTATRPAGAPNGTPAIDSSLTPVRPIYAWSASTTGWIDGAGADV